MTFVSLFAGIGGFDLGLERAGMTCVGQCEIDPHARAVLERHWPTVPKHDDVTTLTVDAFGPADVVTFGSPCQDLSVAGKRAGLDGERSGLFLEAVRYIRDMLEETNARFPKLAVWENVPGAFSSNGGRDFAAVLESLVGGPVGRPTLGWPGAGVAFGPLGCAEWRVLDSRYFGVPQRRRRIFLVYRPRGERAGAVLLEPGRVRWHPPQGAAQGPGAAGGVAGGVGGGSRDVVTALTGGMGSGGPDAAHAQAGWLVPDVTGTLETDSTTGNSLRPDMLAVAPTVTASWGHHGRSSPRGDGTDPIVPVAFTCKDSGQDASEISPTLRAMGHRDSQPNGGGQVAVAFAPLQGGRSMPVSPEAPTLEAGTGDKAPAVAFHWHVGTGDSSPQVDATNALTNQPPQAIAFVENSRAELRLEGGDGSLTGALSTGGGKPGQGQPVVAFQEAQTGVREYGDAGTLRANGPGHDPVGTRVRQGMSVRRLTPRECERLQAFPDDHTRYYPDGREIADTHRYRMLGNAVTVNVAEWIGHRLRLAITGEAVGA